MFRVQQPSAVGDRRAFISQGRTYLPPGAGGLQMEPVCSIHDSCITRGHEKGAMEAESVKAIDVCCGWSESR